MSTASSQETATIAASGTESTVVDTKGVAQFVGFTLPSGLTGTSFSFKDYSTGTGVPIYKEDGTLYTVTVGTSRYIPLNIPVFCGVRRMSFVSGSSESALREIKVTTRPV